MDRIKAMLEATQPYLFIYVCMSYINASCFSRNVSSFR